MKKKVLIVLSYLAVAAAAAAVTLMFSFKPAHYTKLEALMDLLDQRYIDGVDRTELEDAAADAMVGALGDRWSYYIPADEFQAYQEQKNNSYVGIGVTISTLVPDFPWTSFLPSSISMPATRVPSTATITSPARMPASSAGPPSLTLSIK